MVFCAQASNGLVTVDVILFVYPLKQSSNEKSITNNLTDLVVTWEQEDQIFTVGGTMSGGLQLSGTGILEEGTINGHILGRPDVAMMRDDNGDVNHYYVMTRGDVLFATKGRFDDLMGIPLGSVDPLPVELLHSKGVAGGELIFDIPRIDAPDNALYAGHEAWSFVVTENYADADYVYTASYSDQIGGIAESYLNDGIVVPCANCNISPNPTMDPDIYNLRATVAYSDNGSDRFYAWCLRRPTWLAPFLGANGEATYVNIKTDENLDLLHTTIATDQYCRVPNAPTNTNYSPAIGLSTQNDASPQLFTAYTQWPDPITPSYYLGLKTTDWSSTTGFRPEDPTLIVDVSEAKALQVSPNPFTAGFTIDIYKVSPGAVFTLRIYNTVGQEVYSEKGTIVSLNRSLWSVGEQWRSGAYYIELSSEHALYRQKLIKY